MVVVFPQPFGPKIPIISFLLILKEIFFQSKNDEIYNIFNNDLDIINIEEIKLILNKTAPFYSSKWNKL